MTELHIFNKYLFSIHVEQCQIIIFLRLNKKTGSVGVSHSWHKRHDYAKKKTKGRLRHTWREQGFNPFARNPPMVCKRCGIKASKSQVRRGGLGICLSK